MPSFDDNYWGLTDWPWILLYEYGLLNADDTKYDRDPIADDNFCIKLANIEFNMNILVKFDPSLIGA